MKKTEAPAAAVAPKPAEAKPAPAPSHAPKQTHGHHAPPARPASRAQGVLLALVGLVAAIAWIGLRLAKPHAAVGEESFELIQHLTVFVMAVIVGWQVIWSVTPALHTPLMSVTNAISGIIVVGGLLGGVGKLDMSVGVAVIATLFATINIAGGFLVTRRMLAMFRK
jgi:NAD(P) transhydrogenase subunit alpha